MTRINREVLCTPHRVFSTQNNDNISLIFSWLRCSAFCECSAEEIAAITGGAPRPTTGGKADDGKTAARDDTLADGKKPDGSESATTVSALGLLSQSRLVSELQKTVQSLQDNQEVPRANVFAMAEKSLPTGVGWRDRGAQSAAAGHGSRCRDNATCAR